MEKKIQSLETQIALMQSDISTIMNREPKLPQWLKSSALVVLMAMFGQIMTSIWWAASITSKLDSINEEVHLNTDFRAGWHKMHEVTIVSLKEIQIKTEHTEDMLREIKNKLRFVDLKSQVKETK